MSALGTCTPRNGAPAAGSGRHLCGGDALSSFVPSSIMRMGLAFGMARRTRDASLSGWYASLLPDALFGTVLSNDGAGSDGGGGLLLPTSPRKNLRSGNEGPLSPDGGSAASDFSSRLFMKSNIVAVTVLRSDGLPMLRFSSRPGVASTIVISRFSIFGTAAPQSGQTIITYVRNPLHPNLNLTWEGGKCWLKSSELKRTRSVRRGLADPIAEEL